MSINLCQAKGGGFKVFDYKFIENNNIKFRYLFYNKKFNVISKGLIAGLLKQV
jgi:hypothetical protein